MKLKHFTDRAEALLELERQLKQHGHSFIARSGDGWDIGVTE